MINGENKQNFFLKITVLHIEGSIEGSSIFVSVIYEPKPEKVTLRLSTKSMGRHMLCPGSIGFVFKHGHSPKL